MAEDTVALAQPAPEVVAPPATLPRPYPDLGVAGPGNLALPLVAIFVIAVVALLYTVQTSRLATAGIEIQRLEARSLQLQRENQQLLVQVSEARSLAHVEKVATERLKMVRADPRSIHYITLAPQKATPPAVPSREPSVVGPEGAEPPTAQRPTLNTRTWWGQFFLQLRAWTTGADPEA